MASKINNADALCRKLHDIRQQMRVYRVWTGSQVDRWKKALGEVDGRLPAGDAKMVVIQLIGALGDKRGVSVEFKRDVFLAIRRAIKAIDPQWHATHADTAQHALSDSPLLAAYQRAKKAPTVAELVETDWPTIERAMIAALNAGRFTTNFYSSTAGAPLAGYDGIISIPTEDVQCAAYLAQLRERIPPELSAKVEVVPGTYGFFPKVIYHLVKITL